MPTKLVYPKLPDGYRWNLQNKINYKIGKWPGTTTNARRTYITFVEDLTPQEEAEVNAIMADPNIACGPIEFATQNNRFIVKDIYDWRNQIVSECGFDVAISYRTTGTFGILVQDEIIVQPSDATHQMQYLMQGPDEGKLRSALENLIRVE
jgi:hypothetical protein